ncbi:MAG: hypothetical protein M3460_07210 [Actinomycetota bacterium]|nr:hypothetical protein [Actinomycetota bacterium]
MLMWWFSGSRGDVAADPIIAGGLLAILIAERRVTPPVLGKVEAVGIPVYSDTP